MATCEQNGHIYGHDAACVFCGEDRPKNQPHGPVSERFMRHHYGASRGAEEVASHAAIENARRYVRLPTVDADSKRIISALLAELEHDLCERCRLNPSRVCIGCATFADDIQRTRTEGK